MLVPGIDNHTPEHGEVPAVQRLLPTELDFYQAYGWCLKLAAISCLVSEHELMALGITRCHIGNMHH